MQALAGCLCGCVLLAPHDAGHGCIGCGCMGLALCNEWSVCLLCILQVRALQSSPFKSDPEAFAVMAEASEQLCKAYLATATASGVAGGGLRELSAARMHLKGLLKQCEPAFEGEDRYKELQALLAEVVAAEDAALAAKTAAASQANTA